MERRSLDSLFQHLDALDRLLKDWQSYAKTYAYKDILKNRSAFHLCCHAMFRAIQEALDLAGELIVVWDITPRPETYANTFEVLKSHKKLSMPLADKLAELARFRNVLVHQYGKLDYRKVSRHLKVSSQYLQEFQKIVLKEVIR